MTVERNNMATVKAAAATAVYVEDVFSTYLYVGTGATQTITNNIDLSTKGGMVWIKDRSSNYEHNLFDTTRGATYWLSSSQTAASTADANSLTAFGTTGFTLGSDATPIGVNINTDLNVAWTFRKQAKFFDIVSYTGTGSATTIAHNLGSTPGMIIVKRTDATSNWRVYHKNLTSASYYMALNTTAAQALGTTIWNATAPTSSVFSVGADATVNASGGTYIAYLFASNAGGFGSAGTDNVITCGSLTSDASGNATVTLGYEPQYILFKRIDGVGAWNCGDTMRGWFAPTSLANFLSANNSSGSLTYDYSFNINSTGFTNTGGGNSPLDVNATYIYMAIRRGPMKTPTSGTSVYSPITSSAAAGTAQTTNFVVDTQIAAKRTGADTLRSTFNDRLRGISTTATASGLYWVSYSNTAESTTSATTQYWNNTGFQNPTYYGGTSSIYWSFGRAPGFHDVVCYTGTGAAQTISHNLTVAPELMIVKGRPGVYSAVYSNQLTSASYVLYLGFTDAQAIDTTAWNATAPTSSVFSVSSANNTGANGTDYVAYLFATLAGVSKVGSYTGTAAALNIDCGFAAGARFVMIKRMNSTGNWFVYDTARGINASGTNDPYILYNSNAAEVTNTDYLATYSSGFALTSSGSTTTNVSGGTYLYLAIA